MKIRSCCIFLLLIIGSHTLLYSQGPNLLPAPQKAVYGKNKFQLTGTGILLAGDLPVADQQAIGQFISYVKNKPGIPVTPTQHKDAVTPLIVLNCEHTGAKESSRMLRFQEVFKLE